MSNQIMVRVSEIKRPVSGRNAGYRIGLYLWNRCGISVDPRTGETDRTPSWHKGYRIAEVDAPSITVAMVERLFAKYPNPKEIHIASGIKLADEIYHALAVDA